MKGADSSFEGSAAGGRLASLAQPPRATSLAAHRLSTLFAAPPFRASFFPDITRALQEVPAFRPLRTYLSKPRQDLGMFSPARNDE
jgi:hypothetical protein